MTIRIRTLAQELWLPVALVTAWWFASKDSTSVYFPPLSRIMESFRDLWLFERVGSDVVPTLQTVFLGLGLSVLIGVAVGTVLAFWPPVHRAVEPMLQFGWSIPKLAILPAIMAIFGIGSETRLVFVVLGTVWPILLSTVEGFRSLDAVVVETARSYRVRTVDRFFRIYLPGASPAIIAGIRTSLEIALALTVVSEMVASSSGVGFFVLQSQQSFAIPDMWAGALLLGIIGYALNLGFRLIEHRVLRWHTGRIAAVSGGEHS
ncbi:ABC transporter permease [Nocardioides sp. GXZ039]|uniref:ABC transporter permease n=1 Tax=Nocardioides sp. GXZ039 TaxID=3136018 RepID=UPI0030F384F3